tara:strand:- start:390 stop:1553 length:1164 start_codon:yes stop_codon:yes gene_type:complete
MQSIQSYFNPLNFSIYSDKEKWENTQIGKKIDVYIENSFPDLKFAEIAMFNVPEYEGSNNSFSDSNCKIRPFFYSFHHSNPPNIVDLGVLKIMPNRKESFEIIENVCKNLLNHKIIPIVIGGGHDISYAIYKAYAKLEKYINLTVADKKFDLGLEDDNLASFSHLSKIISYKPSYLFNYTHLAYHSYLVSNIAIDMLNAMNFDHLRLGDLKANFKEVEPIMRNTDLFCFDITSIQYTYAAANVYSSPNGLNGEEACRIMRYAGVSDKISAIGLFEYNQNLDFNNQTAYLLAEMLWYFIDGYKIRKNELNPNIKDCIKYTVAFEDGKNEVNFYKSKNSGRWWMGIPFKNEEVKKNQIYYVACSYRDYEIANQGEIPERWVKTINKLTY